MTPSDHFAYFLGIFRASPYAPVAISNDEEAGPKIQLKPKIGRILRFKGLRIISIVLLVACAVAILLYGARSRLNFESLTCSVTSTSPEKASTSTSPEKASTSTSPEKVSTDTSPEKVSISISSDNIDWSRYAYTQYVTNTAYLCNSVMLFEILHRLGSKADRLMMYPASMLPDPAVPLDTVEGRLLSKAQSEYGVKLMPIKVQHRSVGDATWANSYTKLLAFNQTQYDRVLSLDSDSTVLQPMDELFLLPPSPVAMPRAYWLDKPYLSS